MNLKWIFDLYIRKAGMLLWYGIKYEIEYEFYLLEKWGSKYAEYYIKSINNT